MTYKFSCKFVQILLQKCNKVLCIRPAPALLPFTVSKYLHGHSLHKFSKLSKNADMTRLDHFKVFLAKIKLAHKKSYCTYSRKRANFSFKKLSCRFMIIKIKTNKKPFSVHISAGKYRGFHSPFQPFLLRMNQKEFSYFAMQINRKKCLKIWFNLGNIFKLTIFERKVACEMQKISLLLSWA